ncbi:SH2 domain-containing protein 7 isoform 2-T2 [Synchiropus picturatus]
MEPQGPTDSLSQSKELTFRWFIESQVTQMCQNGFFPTWFLGFVCRKEAEEILKDKELGCFLIRLSDKTIGYILTYKGGDRCRHFVISQKACGQFVIAGDPASHNTLGDLIDFYKQRAIEPFGEYLTSPYCQCSNEEIYDRIFTDKRPAVSSRGVVRKAPKQHARQPPTPPPSHRTAEPTASLTGRRFEKQETPPLPLRKPLESSPSVEPDKVVYAQLRKKNKKADRSSQDLILRKYNPLLDCRSRSLPVLDTNFDGRETYRLSAPPNSQPRHSPKTVRRTENSAPAPGQTDRRSREACSYSLDHLGLRGSYEQLGWPPRAERSQGEPVYAEAFSGARRGTYETVPEEEAVSNDSNTYESLEDIKPKNNSALWRSMIHKWKRLFAEAKKKQ